MTFSNIDCYDEEKLEQDLKQLLTRFQVPDRQDVYDTMLNLIRLVQEPHDSHDLSIVRTTLVELRHSFKTFSAYRDSRKVCVFGSARTPEDHMAYQMALEFSKKISQKGYMVITGAGPGIMEAGNRGAEMGMSFGVNIQLPFEQAPNPYIALSSKLTSFKYFFNRKLTFIRESDATVLFPGGFGTHDEGFEVLTLLQTGRCAPRPVIMIEEPGGKYWSKWKQFIEEELYKPGYISEEDLSLFEVFQSVEQAVDSVVSFYRVYHSIRYFGNLAVMRLNQPLSESTMVSINAEFSDLLVQGKFEHYEPGHLQVDQADFTDKHRLVFRFNKITYGRLCQMIRYINAG